MRLISNYPLNHSVVVEVAKQRILYNYEYMQARFVGRTEDSDKSNIDLPTLAGEMVDDGSTQPPKHRGWNKGGEKIKTLVLQMYGGCNMSCKYCYGGYSHYAKPYLMSVTTAMNALHFAFRNLNEQRILVLAVLGAEPMARFDRFREIVLLARQKAQDYHVKLFIKIITNGTILNREILQFLCEHEIMVTVSLDGNRDNQNLLRPFRNGRDSHSKVVGSVHELLSSSIGDNLCVRATITATNNDIHEVVAGITELGVKEINFKPGSLPSSHPLAMKSEDFVAFSSSLEKLIQIYFSDKRKRFRMFPIDIRVNALQQKIHMLRECRSQLGYDYVVVRHDGKLFPCHRLENYDQYCIGSIDAGFEEKRREEWKEKVLCNIPVICEDCWCYPLCGSGCISQNITFSNKSDVPDPTWCKFQEFIGMSALWFYCKMKQETNFRLKEKVHVFNFS